MGKLDPTSLITSVVIICTLYAWIFYFFHRVFPYLRGTRILAGAFLVAALARLGFVLSRLSGHPLFSQTGNVLVLIETAMWYTAILHYLNIHRPRALKIVWFAILPMSAALLARPWISHYTPFIYLSYGAIAALILGLCARDLFRHAASKPVVRLFAIFMTFFSFYSFARQIPAVFFHGASSPSLKTFNNVDFLISIGSINLLCFFFLLLMGNSIMQRMEQESLHDPLTGNLNRRGILAQLEKEIARIARSDYIFSVALVDLDHFKSVNDTLGHAAGDAALCHVSKRITALIRQYDNVGRLGGDEMLLIMPSMDGMGAMSIAERICQSVKQSDFFPDTSLSISIGVAQYEILDSAAAILARADAALYQAKNAGRGCARLQMVAATRNG